MNNGKITLRHAGTLYAIGIGRAYDGTPVVMLVHDRHVTVSHAQTGEILTDLTLDTTRHDTRNRANPEGSPCPECRETSHCVRGGT